MASSTPNKIKEYYAVARGNTVGVFTDWSAASKSVSGYKDNKHKSFPTLREAVAYVRENREGATSDTVWLYDGDNRRAVDENTVETPINSPIPTRWYYAVAVGRETGIFYDWDYVKKITDGYPHSCFQKFGSEAEAQKFLDSYKVPDAAVNRTEDLEASNRPRDTDDNPEENLAERLKALALDEGNNKPK